MATIKVVLHKNWKHNAGTYPIVFRILHNRRKKIIYTGYKVVDSDFDENLQIVSPGECSNLSGRAARKINSDIRKRLKALNSRIALLESQGIEFSVNDLDEKPVKQHNVRFLEYMDKQILFKQNMDNDGIAYAYKSTRNSFFRFLKGKDIKVSEITPKLIRQYADYLRGGNVSENTIAYYMRNLKVVYNRILDDGFKPVCDFPFKTAKTTICKTPKRAISRDLLISIANLDFDIPKELHLELARDVFLFSYYCRGTAFVDIIRLKSSSVSAGTIVFSRQKSKQPIRIKIIPQVEGLIAKYANDSVYVFPILDADNPRPLYRQYKLALQRVNYGLNIIGERVGLDYPLTTYIARHTWATLVKDLGTPISVISEGLGHTSERTTRIYLKEFDTSVLDKVNEAVTKLK